MPRIKLDRSELDWAIRILTNSITLLFPVLVCNVVMLVAHTTSAGALDLVKARVGEDRSGPILKILRGGVPPNPRSWSSTYLFTSFGGKRCTATAVGEKVLLTAAHCVKKHEVGTIDGTAEVTCTQHNRYRKGHRIRRQLDFALCKTHGTKRLKSPETLSDSSYRPRRRDKVKIVGFGCKRLGDGANRSNPGNELLVGDTRVKSRPSRRGPWRYYITTEGKSALCDGDSGGAAYYLTGPNGKKRVIFGVAARSVTSSKSRFSSTFVPEFLRWADKWSKRNNVLICGLHNEAVNCE